MCPRAGKRDVWPEGALLPLETKPLHSRVQPSVKTLHCWCFHSRPENAWRSRAREESDAMNGNREGFPRQAGQSRIDLIDALLRNLTEEFERDVNRFRRNPSGGARSVAEDRAAAPELLSNFVRKFDGDKKSHYIFISSRRTMSSAACDACQRIFSRSPGNRN